MTGGHRHQTRIANARAGRGRGSPFVGRDHEVGRLEGLLDEVARRHEGRVAVLEGEAGIGKTRLLEEALSSRAAARFGLLRGRAEELERQRPFAALVHALDLSPDAADPERATIGALLRSEPASADAAASALEAPELRFRVIEAIVALIEREVANRPLVLALEDLHWADPATLLTLHQLARRLADLPVVLLLSCRPSPRPAELTGFLNALPDTHLYLAMARLDQDAVKALVSELAGGEPEMTLLDLVGGAEGNPLFVTELVGALRAEGAIHPDGGRAALVGATHLPPSLRLTILRRLSFLSREAIETLGAASLLGSSFLLSDLAVVLGEQVAIVLGPLREALDAQVLRESGDRLEFRHELVRDAVYEDLPLAIRVAMHADAGRALASKGAPAGQVATQFARGAQPGDREAVEWLGRAADESAARSPGTAANFLERALELLGEDDAARGRLSTQLATSLLWSGRLAEAEAAARRALESDVDDEAVSLHYALGRVLAYQGRLGESIAHIDTALEDPRTGEEHRPRLLAELSHRRLLRGDIRGAERAAEQARIGGERQEDALAVWTALCALSWTATARGDLGAGVELAERAVRAAGRGVSAPVQLIQPRLYLAFALIDADRLSEGEEALREGLSVAEELGSAWALPLHHAGLALLQLRSGRWDDAAAEAETSLALADDLETRVWNVAAYGTLAQIAFHRDDFTGAQAHVEAAERDLVDGARYFAGRVREVSALLDEARGERSHGLAQLEQHWAWATDAGLLIDWREVAPPLVRLAVAEGRRGLAAEIAGAIEQIAERSTASSATAAALRCRGLLDGNPSTLMQAAERLDGAGRPLELAAACTESAELLAAAGRGSEAEPLLRRALDLYEPLGAQHDIARADARLRELGVRRGRRGKRRRPETGWESLTESERRIAELVAEGLTNPQIAERLFLSRRTVETHVSHALTKLRFSSRVQLAAEAARRATAVRS